MISKIESIKGFGCFNEFTWDSNILKEFKRLNIFYGFNGSGKTTLSNLFYLISRHCSEKDILHNEYIDDLTSLSIETISQKITEKNIKEANINLYVFNSKFVVDHIYDGTKSNLESFGSEANLTNDKIDGLDGRLKVLKIRKNKLVKWEKELHQKMDEIWKHHQSEFNSKITGKRLTLKPSITSHSNSDSDSVSKELISLYQDNERLDNLEQITEGLDSLKAKLEELSLLNIDFESIKANLKLRVDQSSKDKIERKVKDLKKRLGSKFESIDPIKWLDKGGILLQTSQKDSNITCPLCDSTITNRIDSILNDYQNYFSKTFIELISYCDQTSEQLNREKERCVNNEYTLKEINSLFKILKIGEHKLKIPKSKSIELPLEEIIRITVEKKQKSNKELTLLDNWVEILEEYNIKLETCIDEIQKLVNLEFEKVENLKNRPIVDEIKGTIKNVATLDYNSHGHAIIENSNKPNSVIAKTIYDYKKIIENEILELELNRNKEVSKLDAETKFIGHYLEYLGITDFVVKRVKEKETENISISYKSGIRKTSLKYSLSDGEKTALAFAFFLSKIRVEQLEGGAKEYEDCIVVIDDPISSLDENRLYQTANLIDSFFYHNDLAESKMPAQMFLFSHNITFLKYINNILKANDSLKNEIQEYFIDPYSRAIKSLPQGLKNFTNTYLQKLEDIIRFQEKDETLDYDTAKKYLPNYIRIVLETFLSFKLAIVKEDGKDWLPGLNHLIGKAMAELQNYDDLEMANDLNKKGVIKRLNELKKVADNESHGSISKIESINYLSDKELRDYCKYTLQIINFFDAIHFKRVKSLRKR